ncbi:RNA polymerase sigma factor [Flavobacterium sp. GP15]|uniref:RNA polymerase sigma factor n=1 Tax=Flavobacterium sp. GP15 TaxID=2758567 RepID=UPI0021054641|nr:sigma-70 family RNA polymerase sigma factor [Flavobacterium sp. GP15]
MKIKFKNSNHLDDDILWSNVKMGDEKAFSHLFEKHYAHLIRYGNSLSPLKDKVQDCVQEVFTDIWIYRESISESIVVKAYLLSSVRKRIARHQERDRFFGKTTSIDTIEFLLDFSIEHDLIADETTANKVFNLNKLLNELPSRQKEALYLRYHQGLSVDEIASTLDVNYQSANNLLYRAVLNLRKDWKDIILLFLAVTTSLL